MDSIDIDSEKLYVMGDLNTDMNRKSFYSSKLNTQMVRYGLIQIIKDYTQITPDSSTTIDLVFTNNKERTNAQRAENIRSRYNFPKNK